jgi:hypothetical protein
MGDRQGDAARVIRSSVLLRSTLALLAVALAGTGSICAMALATQSKGEVGGPPSIRLGPPDEGTQTSPALVIGQGAVIDGPVELVAYGWESEADSPPADFCVWVEHPPREIQFGTCGTALSRSGRNPIAIDLDAQVVAPKIARATEVGGRISLRVSAVRLYFRRPGSKKPHRVNAVVAQVARCRRLWGIPCAGTGCRGQDSRHRGPLIRLILTPYAVSYPSGRRRASPRGA